MSLKKRLRRQKGWIAALALVAVAAAAWYVTARSSSTEAAQTTYTTEAAATQTLSVSVSGTGNLELSSEREVWPKTSGTVASIEVAVGDTVKKGDVLYTLDSDDAESATSQAYNSLLQARSSVSQATAQLAKAEGTLEDLRARRNDDDPATQAVTSADISGAKADAASAQAQLVSAKAARDSAQDSYDDAAHAEGDLEVKAPISGTVWTLEIEEGDSVSTSGGSSSASTASAGDAAASTGAGSTTAGSSSAAPLTLAPDKPLVATLSINEVDMPALEKGQRVDLEFDALPDLAMTGKVTDIAKSGTVASGVVTFDVTVRLDVTNPQLRPGMTVAASIVTDVARDALVVPSSAVKTDADGGTYVLVMAEGAATPTEAAVETGLASDTQTQITSGLDEGALVVTATSDSSTSSESGESDSGRSGMMMMGGGMGGGTPPSGAPGGGQ